MSSAPVRVLVASRPDDASMNIRAHVVASAAWVATELMLDDEPVLRLADGEGSARTVFLATINDWHIHREGIGEELAALLDAPVEVVLVLSRHRAASGQTSLTIHPVGNPTTADHGGRPGEATPMHPHVLSHGFRALVAARDAAGLDHEVAIEATHHGPFTRVPLVFIEIGSSEASWRDPAAGAAVAAAALDTIRHAPEEGPDVVVGIGGGHYAPQLTKVLGARAGAELSVGHVVASYHWRDRGGVAEDVLEKFLRASTTPVGGLPQAVYLDRKSLPGPDRARVVALLDRLGVPVVRTRDLVDAV